ncbi:lysophosphatidylcholine acyltransferase isoform X1 [Phlebotomus papatasi]|uniref:lysophosphatidylcholine acyltransferase isoform X1 n=1 Tax=Phlebotomus papatasi TaxID=29031 RepID=UPI0024839397|nr:lysophosphatidylcholine acyltransferase isoform X1 [Phlebotomus papatasi]XP_055710714.1 lysophosphatidylcholine acyltransferase isoform X1 [Phlebotomus papatasi]
MEQRSDSLHLINPFVHKMELINPLDKVKTAVFTVLLLPFRVIVICILLLLAWFLACIGLFGLTDEDLRSKPMKGWRRTIQIMTAAVMRYLFMAGSFHRVQFKGDWAPPKKAPILVVAPHSSFFDSLVVVLLGPPAVVAKAETASLPFFGKLINYTQPIYVWREDPNSRQNTIKAIKERANSPEDWPQIIIFPEGTCTNRSCLITFKHGAFYPGVPVQPVCIRYPNRLDTVTWTWEGPGVLKLLWLTLTQVHSACEVEFLPVYVPSAEERANAKLYAHNVRNVMSKALGLPISDYTYDDCKILTRAKEMNLPFAPSIVDVEKLRESVGLNKNHSEEKIAASPAGNIPENSINYVEFCQRLQIQQSHPHAHKLFSLFDPRSNGVIDFREYLLCALFLIKPNQPQIDLVKSAFKLYESSSGGVTRKIFSQILNHTLALPEEVTQVIFSHIRKGTLDFITFDDFVSYAKGKAEFSKIFSQNFDSCEKPKQP